MKQAIFVNGVPASGKSTVTKMLTTFLLAKGCAAVPLSLDTVKESLYAHIGTGGREHNRILGRASYHGIFASIAAFPDGILPIVDAWHGFQPESVLRDHIARAGIERVVEVWCAVSPTTAATRFRERAATRHEGHLPASYAGELFELAKQASPISLGPVIRIDTETSVSHDDLCAVCDILRSELPKAQEVCLPHSMQQS